jgi:dihydrofolate reductase
MGIVRTSMSVSADGFIGSVGESAWDDFIKVVGWMHDQQHFLQMQGMEGDGVTGVDNDTLAARERNVGAYVIGRTMFDFGDEPWGPNPPFHAPVFVLTHRGREDDVREGGTTFTFVTDGIESAISRAREAASERDVYISGGGSPIHQAIAADLLDEIQLHVVPVLLGDGVRLFDQPGQHALERTAAVIGERVTHLTYRIVKADDTANS